MEKAKEKARRTKTLLVASVIVALCCLVLLFSRGPEQPEGAATAILRQEAENAQEKDAHRKITERQQETNNNLANPEAPSEIEDPSIASLKEETFWESINRTSLSPEISYAQFAVNIFPNLFQPYFWNVVKLIATRGPSTHGHRFSKMMNDLAEARAEGLIEARIVDMQDCVDNYLAKMKEAEKEMLAIVEKYPGISAHQGEFPPEVYRELGVLLRGYTTIRLDVPEGVRRITLADAQYGILWNTVFLGLSEHPAALGPLLTIADADREGDYNYEGDNFHHQLDALTGTESSMQFDFSAGNNYAIADAFDRVLVFCANLEDLPPPAMQVAQEYLEWRTERNPPARPTTTVYLWEAVLNPNDMSAQVIGAFADPQDSSSQPNSGTVPFELPLQPDNGANPYEGVENGLTAEDRATIQQFAARFQAAYTNN